VKVVAVSQRVDVLPERGEKRDALDQRLVAFLAISGHVPVPVPNALGGAIREWLAVVHPAAVVLSGGNDIGQCVERDQTESALLTYAQERLLPVLGICRGMQMLAHWSGTGLRPVRGHGKTRHRLTGVIAGEVNSYHSFSLATCPGDFEVISRSEDEEIEAIRHQSLPWEGWMWHPEREEHFAYRDIQRIKVLFGG
jgi:gamma-glutamyl-gamma-aminobutyrate hydrolase PuuD